MSKRAVVEGLYYDDKRRRYVVRPIYNGRRTERTLKARTEKEAVKEFAKLDKTGSVVTVGGLLKAYLDAGTPGAGKMRPRDGRFAAGEQSRCAMLGEYFGTMRASEVEIGHCLMYQKWRVNQLTKNVPGGRTVDLDLGTLANVFRYGCLRGDIKSNPLIARPRFAGKPVHCREYCCRSGDELHTIATALGGILGLQFMFECCSGCRTGEALALRRDAGPGEPGSIRVEGGRRYLCLSRLKQGDDDPHDYLAINPALELVLAALERWHAGLEKPSRWYFPGRADVGDQPLSACALGHALARVGRIHLPKGRRLTSHGARAFYVTWRRVQGADLQQIAAEVGHRSGIKLLLDVYGRNLPAWVQPGDFGPYPKTVAPAWGGGNSTRISTTPLPTPETSQSAPVLGALDQSSCIVLFPSQLKHTMTR